MTKQIKITSENKPYLENLGRRLDKNEIVEVGDDIADFFVEKNLAVLVEEKKERKRARNSKGHYKADNPLTDINEAYE